MFKKKCAILLAAACAVSALSGCTAAVNQATTGSPSTALSATEASTQAHEPLTMVAMVPFRNPSHLQDLVSEQYPEITIEFEPYSGYNGTAFVKEQLSTGEMPDIYIGSLYDPTSTDASEHLIDLSAYAFTDNFTDQQLRAVTDNGAIYMLPLYYGCLGITYNKTLLEKNGWSLPNSLEELEALASEVKEAGYEVATSEIQFPGSGFQYFFNILSTGYVNTIEGRRWQNAFLSGTANAMDNPEFMDAIQVLERWRDAGMLAFTGDTDSDTKTIEKMAEGNTLFMLGNITKIYGELTDDEFGYMPYLSVDGTSNAYIANVTKYIGLNKHLLEPGNEQKLEDALHVMDIICTVDGMRSLTVNESGDVLLPLKDFVIPEDSYYKPIESALNEGYVAPYVYSGWENMVVDVGEKMFSFMRGECSARELAEELDREQYLLKDDSELVYTTVTEEIGVADCAKLVGICFAQASNADVALVSTNEWFHMDGDVAMNTRGVQCPLYAMPITDQEITAMLPTGWTGTIQTVTLTGKRIQELAETGYDKYGDGEHLFPYTLVMPEGFALEDDTVYTVAICGMSKEVQEEGNAQDTGIVGLTAAQEYLSRFETLTPGDIEWKQEKE